MVTELRLFHSLLYTICPTCSLPRSNVFCLQEWDMEMCLSLCVNDVSLYRITISSTSHQGSLCECPWFVCQRFLSWSFVVKRCIVTRGGIGANTAWMEDTKSENMGGMKPILFFTDTVNISSVCLCHFPYVFIYSQRILCWSFGLRSCCSQEEGCHLCS